MNTIQSAQYGSEEASRSGGALHKRSTRRQALQVLGAAAAASAFGIRAAETENKIPPPQSHEALDEAYRLLQQEEPRSRQGLSTHAPMVAEALCALGHPERAVGWIEKYRAPILDLPGPSAPIDPQHWRAALGPKIGVASWESSNNRWADWKEFFHRELAEKPWREVLDFWIGRLAPGMSGAATHGVIRTAHAVRALLARESALRMGELARSLAYWASSYEELPVPTGDVRPLATFADALAEVPLYSQAFGRTPEGRNIVEVLRHVRELDGFAKVRDLIAAPVDLGPAISALTATFARVYLRHGTQHDTIAFVHAVTGPCALRRIAPAVRPETARAALPYAWQTAAAIYSAYARSGETRLETGSNHSEAALIKRALLSGDEHAIKFTEVMVAEHRENPDPIYLAAASDAIGRL